MKKPRSWALLTKWSRKRDSNPRSLAPKASALTKLRYFSMRKGFYSTCIENSTKKKDFRFVFSLTIQESLAPIDRKKRKNLTFVGGISSRKEKTMMKKKNTDAAFPGFFTDFGCLSQQ